jgi:hypothetical protein
VGEPPLLGEAVWGEGDTDSRDGEGWAEPRVGEGEADSGEGEADSGEGEADSGEGEADCGVEAEVGTGGGGCSVPEFRKIRIAIRTASAHSSNINNQDARIDNQPDRS